MHQKLIWSAAFSTLILVPFFFIQLRCTHEPINFEELDTVCYNTQVQPLLINSCGVSGCHDAASASEGLNVHSYQSIMQFVVPGKPRESELYNVLIDIWSDNLMPPDNPLTAEERNIIQVWIAQGAMETFCEDTSGNNGGPIIPPVPVDTICFQQDILPIFLSGCATTDCHDAASHQEGYNLTSYTNIMNSGGIVPFNPGNSEIYEVITEDESEDRMPPSPRSPLTARQIEAIDRWITDGALNSDCPDRACDTLENISYSNQIQPIIQNNCLSCHNSTPANGGVLLNSYENVRTAVETQRGGTSLLLGAIRRENGFSAMPPDYNLSTCDIRIFELWVDQGMPGN